ncbi:right-handed parallel beta-helix repeat-containing protein [Microbulbifer epialgicus]|uniref:Right-handed parallel beta-helix repeat-containing protein n=1 Tax=Microbulbifer epialgicus TaxID=393907 RepID=A0ABV4NY91_9GAMM
MKSILKSAIYPITILGPLISAHTLAVQCYDTVLTPTVLVQPLNCELTITNPYALTIVGPTGSLRMLGAGQIECNNTLDEGNAGILVKGISASVIGGKIDSCPNGIELDGIGSHTILNTQILDFTDNGISVTSSYNTISNSKTIGLNGSVHGIVINDKSNYNTINNNYISSAGSDGINVNGQYTSITLNEIENNGLNGIKIDADNSTISNNLLKFNTDDGIDIETGFNTVSGNVVIENGEDGIELEGTGSENIVTFNYVDNNFEVGITIDSLTTINNTVKNNTSINNGLDLNDDSENMTCTNQINNWSNNDVGPTGTSNPPCLKDQ